MVRLDKNILTFFTVTLKKKRIKTNLLENFQNLVFNLEKISDYAEIEELIRDLAYDLDFYEPDEQFRKEDVSYFGESKALELIENTYEKIKTYKR